MSDQRKTRVDFNANKEEKETEESIRRKRGKFIVSDDEEKKPEKNTGLSSKFPLLLSLSREKDHAEIHNPISNKVSKISLNILGEWNIIGHNPFSHWIMLQRVNEIKITNGLDTHCLSPLPDHLTAPAHFGYVFDPSLSIAVFFGTTRFVVYWHLNDPDRWESRAYVEPEHWPDGFALFDGGLVWINSQDATLHVLTNVEYMEKAEHESYALSNDFKVAPPARNSIRFSAVTDIAQEALYFVCKETKDNGELVLDVYWVTWDIKQDISMDVNLDGLTFFVADNDFGFALELDKAMEDKICYAGFRGLDCALINWKGSLLRQHLEVMPLKACYDMKRVMFKFKDREVDRLRCKCLNMWFLCENESQIMTIPQISDVIIANK